MEASVTLLVICTGCALVAVWAAIVATREASNAQDEAHAIRESKGRIVALEHSIDVLDSRVKRAVGTAYEARSRARARYPQDDLLNGAPSDGEPEDGLESMLSLQKAPPVRPGA